MGTFGWERMTVGQNLMIWSTTPDATYSIVILETPSSWTVSLHKHCIPLHTVTDITTRCTAKQTAHRFQFQVSLGAVESAP